MPYIVLYIYIHLSRADQYDACLFGDVSQAVAEVNSLFMDRLRATSGGLLFAPDVKTNRTEDRVIFHVTCTFFSLAVLIAFGDNFV